MAGDKASRTVLCIDDEPDIREALKFALESEGYTFVAAQDFATALRLADERKPAVILLDLHIPGLDLRELIVRLRLQGIASRVVLMTAGADASKTARELGLKRCLPKPFELDELLAVVRECAGK